MRRWASALARALTAAAVSTSASRSISSFTYGNARLRIGQVTLSDGRRTTGVTEESTWAVGIKKNQIARFLPPGDIFIAQKSFKGGLFRYNNTSERLGLMTIVGCCFFFDATVFADFINGFDVDFVDAAEVSYSSRPVLARAR